MTAIVSSKGQIVLPVEIRREDAIVAGQAFEVVRIKRGEYRLKRKEPPRNEGLVDWLLECPVKGFMENTRSGATTDSIRPALH